MLLICIKTYKHVQLIIHLVVPCDSNWWINGWIFSWDLINTWFNQYIEQVMFSPVQIFNGLGPLKKVEINFEITKAKQDWKDKFEILGFIKFIWKMQLKLYLPLWLKSSLSNKNFRDVKSVSNFNRKTPD